MKHLRALQACALVGVVVVTIAACGSDSKGKSGSTTTTKPAPASEPLEGTRWNLEDTAALPLAGVAVTATFADGAVDGSSGCNQYSGTYETKGDGGLTIAGEIASTRIACEPGPTEVERAYLERLPQVKSYVISGTTLTLRDSADKTILVYQASQGATEIVGKWTVTTFYTGSAVQSVADGSLLTAEFKADQVVGDGGCNSFSGPYEVTGSDIKMGPFVSTLRACEDEALQTQENQYTEALQLATKFEVRGNTLALTRADGGVAVTFKKG
jgi:heat shock protein HslJ